MSGAGRLELGVLQLGPVSLLRGPDAVSEGSV